MSSEDKQKECTAQVIQFPRHRIVRWPRKPSADDVKKKVKAAIRALMDYLEVG